jgi:hypothetical protein
VGGPGSGAALLSKETAAVVPALAFLWALLADRDPPAAALRRAAPLVLLTAAWAALHPALGGGLWWARGLEPLPHVPAETGVAVGRTLLALVNLDLAPAPQGGWAASLTRGLGGGAAIAALMAWPAVRSAAGTPAGTRGGAGRQAPAGPDYFFVRDSLGRWREVVKGPEPADGARRELPRWTADHEELAQRLVEADDVASARVEYEKLAAAAAEWYSRAAALPGADEEMRARAREFQRR